MAIYKQLGHEVIASVASSTGFTAAEIAPDSVKVIYALVQPLGGSIRVRCDGTPTASIGTKYNAEDIFEVWGQDDLQGFRAIDDGGTATLDVSYFGTG